MDMDRVNARLSEVGSGRGKNIFDHVLQKSVGGVDVTEHYYFSDVKHSFAAKIE